MFSSKFQWHCAQWCAGDTCMKTGWRHLKWPAKFLKISRHFIFEYTCFTQIGHIHNNAWQQQAPPHKYHLHGFARQALSFYMGLVSKRYWLFPAVTHHINIPICTDIAFSVYTHTTVYSTYDEICTRFCCALHGFDISSLLSGGMGFINP